MRKLNALLVLLISSLAITGISFIDDQVWNVIFLVVGMVAYAIVGFMFSIWFLHENKLVRKPMPSCSFYCCLVDTLFIMALSN